MNKAIFSLILIIQSFIICANEINDCSKEAVQKYIQGVQREYMNSDGMALSFKIYHNIDNLMACDFKGQIDQNDKAKVKGLLTKIKKEKVTKFVWADSEDVSFWEDGVEKLSFLPEKIREDLPIILSQLNSSVIAFVPSEEMNQTHYNFESDLGVDLFSPWDRRDCDCIPSEDIDYINEDINKERISSDLHSNFTRNYSAIEVSKIGIHQQATCFWYKDTNSVKCEQEFESSIVHEVLHLLETRYPEFIKLLHNAKGGYKDRLKLAQSLVPAFGVTKCTEDTWEEHCSEGPISKEETKLIVDKTLPPQDTGVNAGRYYARKMDPESSYCGDEIIIQGNEKFCVAMSSESLYTYVRGGEEYISVLLEKAIVDPAQFDKVASKEEKALFNILKSYIF